MLYIFIALIAIGTFGWPYETPFDQIVPGEDYSVTEEPHESRNFWPNIWGPYQFPERVEGGERGASENRLLSL